MHRKLGKSNLVSVLASLALTGLASVPQGPD
jgi:hypothetical protein